MAVWCFTVIFFFCRAFSLHFALDILRARRCWGFPRSETYREQTIQHGQTDRQTEGASVSPTPSSLNRMECDIAQRTPDPTTSDCHTPPPGRIFHIPRSLKIRWSKFSKLYEIQGSADFEVIDLRNVWSGRAFLKSAHLHMRVRKEKSTAHMTIVDSADWEDQILGEAFSIWIEGRMFQSYSAESLKRDGERKSEGMKFETGFFLLFFLLFFPIKFTQHILSQWELWPILLLI